jgi:hypothetical protein
MFVMGFPGKILDEITGELYTPHLVPDTSTNFSQMSIDKCHEFDRSSVPASVGEARAGSGKQKGRRVSASAYSLTQSHSASTGTPAEEKSASARLKERVIVM